MIEGKGGFQKVFIETTKLNLYQYFYLIKKRYYFKIKIYNSDKLNKILVFNNLSWQS
jgi:hypothetical protein